MTACGPTSNVSQGRTSCGTACASARATSAIPECPATTGSAPHAAASAATIPNDSGNVLGIASASAAGSTSASSSWSSRPAQWIRAVMPLAAARYAAASGPSASRNAASSGSSRPSSPRSARAVARSPRESAAASPSSCSRNEPKPTTSSRASGTRPSTSGQAASSSSTPFEAISLPTNVTIRSRPGSSAPSATAASAVERANDDAIISSPAAEGVSPGAEGVSPGADGRARALHEARAQAFEAGRRGLPLARLEAVHVDARGAEAGPLLQARVLERGPQALRGVARADEHARGAGQPLARGRQEARVRLDRVLQRAAVDLHGVRHAGAGQRARQDQRPHHEVVGQRDVRPRAGRDFAHRGHVAIHVARDLFVAQRRVRPRLDAFVAVRHVDREQRADVGPVHGRAGRIATDRQVQRAAVPVAGGVDPRQLERRAVLAEQVHFVAEAYERLTQRGVVHVRAGPLQQVAMEDQHAHGGERIRHPAVPTDPVARLHADE